MNVCFPFLTGSFSKTSIANGQKRNIQFCNFHLQWNWKWKGVDATPISSSERIPNMEASMAASDTSTAQKKMRFFPSYPQVGAFPPWLTFPRKKARIQSGTQTRFHTGSKPNFLSKNCQEFEVWKMWILWKMRLLKCEFCKNWGF